MSNSLYNQTIPVFEKYLNNLQVILDKSVKHADAKGIKHEDLLNFRLIEDMRPLIFQVQSVSNAAKAFAVRVGGLTPFVLEDDETTFEQLQARVKRTIEILREVKPEELNAKQDTEIIMETKMGNFRFESGQAHASNYVIPYFHFHLTTAYCLMRHQGVDVGAFDYLGKDTFVKV